MQQIADWLKKLGVSEYAERFAEERIEIDVLPELTDQDLERLRIPLGHRRRMLRKLSKATVCKAVSRIEAGLGARLINRTSRRFALTDAGRHLATRPAQLLADGEAAEDSTGAGNIAAWGSPADSTHIVWGAPLSFGVLRIAPLLPEFLPNDLEVTVDLHLSDAMVDLVGVGFDAAVRIATLPDPSLVARRHCEMRYLVGSPVYLNRHGRPKHPL
jgi:DNA-binding transcriptional LysR family regulator